MKKVTLICATVITSLLIWGCKDPESSTPTQNCTPADGKMAELSTPVAGKTFKVGDTVKIEYKLDVAKLKGTLIDISVSADDGMNWSDIHNGGISVSESQGQYQCLSYDWIIGKEHDYVSYASVNDKCILRIYEYGTSNQVVFSQDKFTIKK